MLNTKKFF